MFDIYCYSNSNPSETSNLKSWVVLTSSKPSCFIFFLTNYNNYLYLVKLIINGTKQYLLLKTANNFIPCPYEPRFTVVEETDWFYIFFYTLLESCYSSLVIIASLFFLSTSLIHRFIHCVQDCVWCWKDVEWMLYNKEGCIKLKIDFYTTSLYCLSVLRTILLLQNLRLGRCCQGLG